jgi:sirohydrochlorin cobaltochelatase
VPGPPSTHRSEIPLIGLAHGSRHPGVRPSIESLLAAAGVLAGVPAHPAYLDLTEPHLAAVVAGLAAAGFERAVVVPLLFTSAFHATVDVPATARAAAESSGLDLAVAEILGTGDDVRDLVRNSSAEAGINDADPLLLFSVGSSSQAANDAVHDLGVRLNEGRSGPIRAGFGTTEPRGRDVLEQLAQRFGSAAIVPLFVSPGLLLDPLAHLARDRGWIMAPPLGARLAPLVAARYRDRARSLTWSG